MRFALDVRVRQEVLAIDRTARTVTVRNHRSGVDYVEHWDHLVLSMGAEAVVPSVPGVERAQVLRDVADADAVVRAAENARTAVVIGAGFIGLEMAENLHAKGLSVALVEQAGQVLPPLDPEMAQPVAAHLRAHGVAVQLGARVDRIGPDTVVLGDGSAVPADPRLYYPGAAPLSLKLLIDAGTDGILGAQAVGTEGAARRIDVLATAMAGGLRVSDLLGLDLAYAPQYGSAKDPVNMLGYVADNLASVTTTTVQWHELDAARAAGAKLLDVRTPDEFAAGAIPGALNVPLDRLRQSLTGLPPGRLICTARPGSVATRPRVC